jgi:outer membrane biosynthesis protein TonB
MTARDVIQHLRERKGTALSVALHLLVFGYGLVTFSSRSVEAPQEDVIPVDISVDNTSKAAAGIKSGKKENPKPLAEKVAEAKPVDDVQGKVGKTDIATSTSAPDPTPKPVEKPVEKKPDPPKQAEDKPKEEPKQADKKPDPAKVDPIAEALKSEEAKKPKPKPQPKQEAKAAPTPPQPKQERVFDQTKISALLDKRDPTRESITGSALNASASLGTHTGNSQQIVATWKGAFIAAVRRCFNFPYNGMDADQFEADVDIYMRPDGMLASQPSIVAVRGPSASVSKAMGESAARAVVQCQAYAFLPKEQYETWKYIPMTFFLKDMM